MWIGRSFVDRGRTGRSAGAGATAGRTAHRRPRGRGAQLRGMAGRSLEPPGQAPQPAADRRRRHLQPLTGRAVPGTAGPSLYRGADHIRGIRPPQQHRHRQQHMRHQARAAPRPPRTQRPLDTMHSPPPGPPPRPQHLTTHRRWTGELATGQPRLDQNRVSLYRQQRCLRGISTALSQRFTTTSAGGPLSSSSARLFTSPARRRRRPTHPSRTVRCWSRI